MTIDDNLIKELINKKIDEELKGKIDEYICEKVNARLEKNTDITLEFSMRHIETYVKNEIAKQVTEVLKQFSEDNLKELAKLIADDLKGKLTGLIVAELGYRLSCDPDEDLNY